MFLPILIKGFTTVGKHVRVMDSKYSVYVLVIYYKANFEVQGQKKVAAY